MERLKKGGTWVGIVAAFLVLAELLHLAERNHAEDGASILSTTDALWYALVTLTTVGYGDYYPVTPLGKLIGGVFVLASLGVLGLLLGQVSGAITGWREKRRLGHHGFDGEDHIVVIGYNSMVEDIVRQLLTSSREMVIITDEIHEIDQIHGAFGRKAGVFPLYSKYNDPETLAHAGFEKSFRVLLALEADTRSLVTMLELRRHYPGGTYLVSIQNDLLLDTFYSAGAHHVFSTQGVTAMLVASLIFEPDVAAFARDLIATTPADAEGFAIQQYLVSPNHTFAGKTFGEVHETLYEKWRVVAVALARREGGRSHVIALPEDDEQVRAGDYVLMVMREELEPTFEGEVFGVPNGVRT